MKIIKEKSKKTNKYIFLILVLLISLLGTGTNARESKHEILEEIYKLQSSYITINGANVFLPSTVKRGNELLKSYNNSKDDYFYDMEKGKSNYKIKELNVINEDLALKKITELLDSEIIPKDIIKNLNIHLSPYKLDKVIGYSVTYNLDEAENYIIISSDLNELENNLYHELGHIYWNNLSNSSDKLKESFLSLYGEYYFNENIWEYNTEENFAEDFKLYLYSLKGERGDKRGKIPFNPKIKKIIEENLSEIKIKNGKFYPYLIIKNELNNKVIRVSTKNDSINELFLRKGDYLGVAKVSDKQGDLVLKAKRIDEGSTLLLYYEDAYKVTEVTSKKINYR